MIQTVDVLLKNGADVAAKDVSGSTPLHTRGALYSPEMRIFEKLVSYAGDVKCENLQGQSPIEQLASISSANGNPTDSLTIFKRYGYRINTWNRITGEGYIATIFLQSEKLSENSEFEKFVDSVDAKTVDDMGRTAIQNLVFRSGNVMNAHMIENYKHAIESFMKIGIDIDHRDESGRTALHYAARIENTNGVKGLLTCGADLNAVDNSGESPVTLVMKNLRDKCSPSRSRSIGNATLLFCHVKKLQHLKIVLFVTISSSDDMEVLKLPQTFFNQIKMTKTMDVGTNSLNLFDFLSETAALTLYPLLHQSERNRVDHFFDSLDYKELTELEGIIKLQTRKMMTRMGLIDSALSSLRTLLGFSDPGLCKRISRFLLNSDLTNIIELTTPKARIGKLSEISS